jgi:hypothetical protein
MSGFYSCIIIIGILVEFIAFVWILIDKKNKINYKKIIDSKKNNLLEIIEDADIMVDELNKFSDYIVSEFDKREKKLELYFEKADKICINEEFEMNERTKNGTDNLSITNNVLSKGNHESHINDLSNLNINKIQKTISRTQMNLNSFKDEINDKIIHLHPKYRKIFNLKENGLSQSDIARELNMGREEVKLILDMWD